jgi:hypothetical protein
MVSPSRKANSPFLSVSVLQLSGSKLIACSSISKFDARAGIHLLLPLMAIMM